MLDGKIKNISRIVGTMTQVAYPEPPSFPVVNDDLADVFETALNALLAPGDEQPAVIRVADTDEATKTLVDLCDGVPVTEIIWQDDASENHRGATLSGGPDAPASVAQASRLCSHHRDGGATESLERNMERPRDHTIGITTAVALIAATGSVIVELSSARAGHASLLVERHIVIASRDQLLPDLDAFYRNLSDRVEMGERPPIQVCITGCSRTADIEKLLVVPAHGPRQIQVVLCDAPTDRDALFRGTSSLRRS